ncbi:hypothetical protein DUI87_27588 [Hirundo rustica rustica]|uniref:Integrase-type domain-containing protein n=1 Tax=Hirundo rustica rustica TaxID=333673 RepID=A0A3M0J4T9_HIRRU|nr:hypothetical protein DUI87_27588 [Hirundo rustica rustica]
MRGKGMVEAQEQRFRQKPKEPLPMVRDDDVIDEDHEMSITDEDIIRITGIRRDLLPGEIKALEFTRQVSSFLLSEDFMNKFFEADCNDELTVLAKPHHPPLIIPPKHLNCQGNCHCHPMLQNKSCQCSGNKILLQSQPPPIIRHFSKQHESKTEGKSFGLVRKPRNRTNEGPFQLITWGKGYACVSTAVGPKWLAARHVKPYRVQTQAETDPRPEEEKWARRPSERKKKKKRKRKKKETEKEKEKETEKETKPEEVKPPKQVGPEKEEAAEKAKTKETISEAGTAQASAKPKFSPTDWTDIKKFALKGDTLSMDPKGIAMPVTYDAHDANPKWERLDREVVRDLMKAVRDNGLGSPYFKQLLKGTFNIYDLTPFDLRSLATMILSDSQFILWEAKWRKILNDYRIKYQGGANAGFTVAQLAGDPPLDSAARQASFLPRDVLTDIKDAARKAMVQIPPAGVTESLFTDVKQGPSEPFASFIDRLTQAVDRQVIDEGVKSHMIRCLAFANANPECKRVISAMPGQPTMAEILEACSKVSEDDPLKSGNDSSDHHQS